MRIRAWFFAACALSFGLGTAHAQNYSTGAVDIYNTCNTGPDLPQTIPEAANVRHWWDLAKFPKCPAGKIQMCGTPILQMVAAILSRKAAAMLPIYISSPATEPVKVRHRPPTQTFW